MKSRWGAGVDAHKDRYFVWWGGSGGGSGGVVFCLFLRLKSWIARRTSYHLAFIGNCPTISHKFLLLSIQWMSSPLKKWRRGVSPRFHFIVFVFGVNPRVFRSPRFSTPTVESFSVDLLPAIKNYWAESHLELFKLLRLNLGARGEDFTSLLSWIVAWLLLITHVWSVYLVN